MLKNIFLLFSAWLISGVCLAQPYKPKPIEKRDTVSYFLKNTGWPSEKDSADYALFIFKADTVENKIVYPFAEYYMNGKRKMTGVTLTKSYILRPDGPVMSFFKDGRRKSIVNWVNGKQAGDATEYYPNGKIYAIKKYLVNSALFNGECQLIECRDSTGNVLAENGKGRWLKWDADFKNITQEGPISNSLENGEWTLFVDGHKYGFVYNAGLVTKPVKYEFDEKVFSISETDWDLRKAADIYGYLNRAIRYPAEDRENHTQGWVYVSFIIEKDGSLTDIRSGGGPSQTISIEALKVMITSPKWAPATIAGAPVRSRFILPINFTLAKDND